MSELNASNLRKEQGNEGPDLVGLTELTSPYFMVPPSGTTAQRPQNPQPGTLRFNTDIGSLEYFKGDTLGWETIVKTTPNLGGAPGADHGISNTGTGARGLFNGGYRASPANLQNNIDWITIPTLGNASDFGNTLDPIKGQGCTGSRTRLAMFGGNSPGGYQDNVTYVTFASTGDAIDTGDLVTACMNTAMGNQIRGIISGASPYTNTMEYTTLATLGDTKDYGDLTTVRGYAASCTSTTRGLIGGGINNPSSPSINVIDYVTIMTTGNAVDYGDLGSASTAYETTAFSNATRGFFAAGYRNNYSNSISYVTIATLGNTTEFGDLTNMNGTGKYSCSSPTRGVIAGGYYAPATPYSNTMEYITLQTLGNGTEFGDMTNEIRSLTDGGGSNAHGGL